MKMINRDHNILIVISSLCISHKRRLFIKKIYLNLSNSPRASNPESGLKAGNFSPKHVYDDDDDYDSDDDDSGNGDSNHINVSITICRYLYGTYR